LQRNPTAAGRLGTPSFAPYEKEGIVLPTSCPTELHDGRAAGGHRDCRGHDATPLAKAGGAQRAAAPTAPTSVPGVVGMKSAQ